jgi:hypothetical protein
MGTWSANQQGWLAVRRVFDDPASGGQDQGFRDRIGEYDMLWSYYSGSMFDRQMFIMPNVNRPIAPWQAYKSRYNLYRNIRLIYNPTRRLVDFYASQVYPGLLSEDGLKLPDGGQLAIPFAKDTDPALCLAIAQIWQWSNWQAKKAVLVRYGAALGSVLVEIVDDVEFGKVHLDVMWPGLLYDIVVNAAGDVKSYTLQYPAVDDAGEYIYRKEVDTTSIRYFKNGQKFDYGQGAVVENLYGFIPAVWCRHQDVGGIHGSPAIAGSMGKIDELNNLAAHVHDQIHKVIGAPIVLWANGSVNSLFAAQNRPATNEFEQPMSEQEQVLMLKGPQGGSVESLAGALNLSDSAIYMDRLITELEADHPELSFYDELRSMSAITGPSVSRIVGDVSSRVGEAQAAYDTQMVKLFAMAVAIAGMRANSGAWGILNRQQVKFVPFDLDSYEDGDLDMTIMPRPLIVPTKQEKAQEKTTQWTGVGLAVTAGVPLQFVMRDEGYTDDELKQLTTDLASKIQEDQLAATEDVVPATPQ